MFLCLYYRDFSQKIIKYSAKVFKIQEYTISVSFRMWFRFSVVSTGSVERIAESFSVLEFVSSSSYPSLPHSSSCNSFFFFSVSLHQAILTPKHFRRFHRLRIRYLPTWNLDLSVFLQLHKFNGAQISRTFQHPEIYIYKAQQLSAI